MKNRLISGIGAILAGLLVAVGPQTIFRLCGPKPDGTWMKCHWTGQAELGVGLFIAALGVLLLVFSNEKVRLGLSLAAVLAGVLVLLLPTALIGGCSMSTMNCQRLTFPALEILGSLTVAGFTFNSVFLLLGGRGRREESGS